ncbi:MAG: phosphate regulon transcriptional regulator PhoB [Holosporaceae bacterium]|jgi:two-component system phosphate regulon response regulator PhoB
MDTELREKILVVEDEASLRELLQYNLEKEGYRVTLATDGEDGLLHVEENKPDLIVLDWMLPQVSGIEVCRRLRRSNETKLIPILMLTAKGEEADMVRGLSIGADDYMTKPFSVVELVARVKALLRRSNPARSEESLTYRDLTMDLRTYRVSRAGSEVHVGPTEFKLLRYFMENPGRVFTREQLLDAVWGSDIYVEPRTVDVHIRRLRVALNPTGGEDCRDYIRTVRSAGYALDDSAE